MDLSFVATHTPCPAIISPAAKGRDSNRAIPTSYKKCAKRQLVGMSVKKRVKSHNRNKKKLDLTRPKKLSQLRQKKPGSGRTICHVRRVRGARCLSIRLTKDMHVVMFPPKTQQTQQGEKAKILLMIR